MVPAASFFPNWFSPARFSSAKSVGQFLSLGCALALILCPRPVSAAANVQTFLETGRIDDGIAASKAGLRINPNDHSARFGLGVLQFLRAVEQLGQSQHRYGLLHERAGQIPFLRLPTPKNQDPEQISYAECRAIFARLAADLQVAEATLAQVDTADVKLPLYFGRIRLDLDGDGEASAEETFWRIFALFHRGVDASAGEKFRIALDGGDVHWLRGYCHLLMAFCDMILAHDWQELFERCGHLVYPRAESPHTFLAEEDTSADMEFEFRLIADTVAFVHLINFDVIEPDRMRSAHQHLLSMIGQSRASWQRILAETDDDDEWLPNPNQQGVIPNVRIRRDMIDGWHELLDELEAVLRGRKLIPFWRGYRERFEEVLSQSRGVNLQRVFTQPRRFDLVMWVSGTAATPYLEEGQLAGLETWNRLMRIFGGEFFGFAIWFN